MLLALILAVLLGNSYAFWLFWWRDKREYQTEVQRLMQLTTTYRRVRTAEKVSNQLTDEVLDALNEQEQPAKEQPAREQAEELGWLKEPFRWGAPAQPKRRDTTRCDIEGCTTCKDIPEKRQPNIPHWR